MTDKLLAPVLDQKMGQGLILIANANKQNPDVSKCQSCFDLFPHDKAFSTLHSNLIRHLPLTETSNLLTPRALFKLSFSLRSHYFLPFVPFESSSIPQGPLNLNLPPPKNSSQDCSNLSKRISPPSALVCPGISFTEVICV